MKANDDTVRGPHSGLTNCVEQLHISGYFVLGHTVYTYYWCSVSNILRVLHPHSLRQRRPRDICLNRPGDYDEKLRVVH
jgi:hypothetical protein